jgi:hypothetical protein
VQVSLHVIHAAPARVVLIVSHCLCKYRSLWRRERRVCVCCSRRQRRTLVQLQRQYVEPAQLVGL